MHKQRLYIITGLPYSGKTTLKTEIVKLFNFPVVSVDEFLDIGNYMVEEMEQKDWDEVYSQAFSKLKKLLPKGNSVIFDGGSLLISERETLKNIAAEQNIPHKLIYVNTPKEVIRKRWLENQKLKTRGHVEENTLNKAFEMFEEPTAKENVMIYDSKIPIEIWVKDNIS